MSHQSANPCGCVVQVVIVVIVVMIVVWTCHVDVGHTRILQAHFPEGIAVRTLLFGRIFAKFLGVVHVGDQGLRFFAELVDLLRLFQILNNRWFNLLVLELLDQPLDTVLAYCILRLDCRKRYSGCSVLQVSP